MLKLSFWTHQAENKDRSYAHIRNARGKEPDKSRFMELWFEGKEFYDYNLGCCPNAAG